ncbi:YggT family protein [Nodosilinea sp. PGN35]|uniref:YggT family protein n=1 Tax=Nodosilinea sp. PGN35 TaxID=3020489 RepID=UPI0023B2165D|nr:YggT family protein [Nodosilinea sp. TSF1-S3]MDF0365105.1 YggT family protein [Nodosilinea sp. TSF1-S3]
MSQTPNGRNEFERDRELIHNQEVYRLRQEHERLRLAQRRARLAWVRNTIILLVGALEILLCLRLFLRLTNANPDNPFAQTIYTLSEPFMRPFSTLFISPTSADATRIFDVNNLIAMLVYALLGALGVALINYLQGPGFQSR